MEETPVITKTSAPGRQGRRARPGNTTGDVILNAAEFVFARHGYAGATVKRIAKQAKCYESLIYYHFGNKDKLFAAVIKNAYQKLIKAEQALDLDMNSPEQALTDIVLFMWNYYQKNPELIILLNTENLLKGKHLAKLGPMDEFLSPALSVIREAVLKGGESGVFRRDVDILDLYTTIMGLGYFYLSNRYTLSVFFGRDLMQEAERRRWGQVIVQTVLATLRPSCQGS